MIDHWLQLPAGSQLLVGAYLIVVCLLAVCGLHRWGLALRAGRARRPVAAPLGPDHTLPRVTVQLPIYNERYVVERLLDAAAALDWPRDRLEIQVLDDSTDDTSARVAREVERLRRDGLDIVQIRRAERTGFKAGALAAGLERAKGELIAIFDADFVPRPDFLRATVGHFSDPGVGLVQVRWGHINRDYSWLTRVQAVLLDGHFLVEHEARAASGYPFNFNGTAGIWRRAAIEDAGGWQSDTLTEDLDLSYRAQLAGWRFVFRSDIEAPAELPVDFDSFKSQQLRWARGSAQSARKLLPRVWRAPLPLRSRIEATFHLTGNFAYLLLLALALLAGPAIELRYRQGWTQTLAIDLPFFVLAMLSVVAFYARPLERAGPRPWRWFLLPALMAVGIGMSLNNARAVLLGLLVPAGEFQRTPKFGVERKGERWREKRYRAGKSLWLAAELLLAVAFTLLLGRAWSQGLWPSLPFLTLFAAGFASTALGSLSVPRAACAEAPASPQVSPGTSS